MSSASEPMLAWLRKLLSARTVNTAELAKKSGIPRPRLRRILVGTEPMLVDELFSITRALEVAPSDLALPQGVADPPLASPAPTAEASPNVDPWGNQPEQLFRIAFALGCDLLFTAETSILEDSGLPAYILQQYREGQVPVQLDAMFHRHHAPRYAQDGITLTLSFDALYECRFPWASIRRMIFTPLVPDAVERPAPEPPKGRPKLRLVE